MPLLGPNGQPLNAEKALEDAHAALEGDTALPAPVPCVTAFAVAQVPGGEWHLVDIDTDLVPDRKVNFDDITAGASVILREESPCPDYPEGPVRVVTAFIIYQLPDGLWQAATDLDIPLVPERSTISSDVIGGLSVSLRDVSTQEIVQQTANAVIPNVIQGVVQTQMAMAAKAKEQFEANAIAAKMEQDKHRRGGR